MNVQTLGIYCRSGPLSGSKFRAGFELMLTGDKYAKYVDVCAWDFAVGIDELLRCGLCKNDLRLLIRLRLVEHAIEIPAKDGTYRRFRATAHFAFSDQSCFILTDLGVRVAQFDDLSDDRVDQHPPGQVEEGLGSTIIAGSILPHWDAALRVLSYQGTIVKRFARPACNQALILSAFEEEHWPLRIDDPLVPNSKLDVKRRLCDTIKCLNQGQARSLLRFRGDGSGEGVVWEPVG